MAKRQQPNAAADQLAAGQAAADAQNQAIAQQAAANAFTRAQTGWMEPGEASPQTQLASFQQQGFIPQGPVAINPQMHARAQAQQAAMQSGDPRAVQAAGLTPNQMGGYNVAHPMDTAQNLRNYRQQAAQPPMPAASPFSANPAAPYNPPATAATMPAETPAVTGLRAAHPETENVRGARIRRRPVEPNIQNYADTAPQQALQGLISRY